MNLSNIQAIVTDIEGTTSSIGFVHQILFPYASANLERFLEANAEEPFVAKLIYQVLNYGVDGQSYDNSPCDIAMKALNPEQIQRAVEILQHWIKLDLKIKPLKDLQGLIWKQGYEKGDYQGQLYEDAYLKLTEWHKLGIPLYVYSSGSITAQKLLFGYTEFGDLNYMFAGNFDTTVGGKKESKSYSRIAQEIKQNPENILFLSDIDAELDAAREAGFQTIQLVRDSEISSSADHPQVKSFLEIDKMKEPHS